ncbi:MAG: hypothetical protein AB7P12_10930 [Alphaproteobacteria bacterium]
MFAAKRYPRSPVIDPWRLVRVAVDADPSAGEYGLLDPRLAEEPEFPRGGLLSQAVQPETPMPTNEPSISGTTAMSAWGNIHPYKMVPGPLREQSLPMPPYIQAPYDQGWHPFHHSLRRSGMPSGTEIRQARTMFAYEGGMKPNPENDAVAGITQGFLKDAHEYEKDNDLVREYGRPLPDKTTELSSDDVARLYKDYFDMAFDHVAGEHELTRIRDPKAAGQMIDLLFMEGKNGGKLIQEAMNDLVGSLPDHVQHRLGVDQVRVDGDIGDMTFSRFNRLINAGFDWRLRNDVVDRALVYFTDKHGTLPRNIEERINQYR